MEKLEQLILPSVKEQNFDEVTFINTVVSTYLLSDLQVAVQNLLHNIKTNFRKNKNDFSLLLTYENLQKLSVSIEQLNKRLQEHTHTLRKNETSLSSTNSILESDLAKNKTDNLIDVLNAKIMWIDINNKIQFVEENKDLKFENLALLQKSYNILQKYISTNSDTIKNFEKNKDEYLLWLSSATISAIDNNNVKKLENLKEKYLTLDRLTTFEQIFGNYSKNKINCFVEENIKTTSLWNILYEIFVIWKRCYKLTETLDIKNRSNLISQNLYEGVLSKWNEFLDLISNMMCSNEFSFNSAKEIGKTCNDFLVYVKSEGDLEINNTCQLICEKIFSALSEDYGKYVLSVLLCTINKITLPDKKLRYKYDWLLPYIDEIHFCMKEIIIEAKSIFGAEFSQQIIIAFDNGIKELYSIVINKDVLNIKLKNNELSSKNSEDIRDKILAISITGSLLNMVNDINDCINENFKNSKILTNSSAFQQISNDTLLENLNQLVLKKKIESIANVIIRDMNDEMTKLKSSIILTNKDNNKTLQIELPNFSVSPHNYITNVGHALLDAMNTINLFATNKNFVKAVISVTKKSIIEDELDLWMLTQIGNYVMEAFCNNVGNVSQLNTEIAKQFYADIVFFMEALIDLRIQPTSQLNECASKLKKIVEK